MKSHARIRLEACGCTLVFTQNPDGSIELAETMLATTGVELFNSKIDGMTRLIGIRTDGDRTFDLTIDLQRHEEA